MNLRNLRWFAANKAELPGLLLGRDLQLQTSSSELERCLRDEGVAVAFAEYDIERTGYARPHFVVCADRVIADTLAWMKAFAADMSPMSQFAQVISESDWRLFFQAKDWSPQLDPSDVSSQTDRWASVIVGELLAQGDSSSEPKSIQLSHAALCFTSTFARAHLFHGGRECDDVCVDRMLALDDDPHFAKRHTSVRLLAPIWSLFSGRFPSKCEVFELVELFLARAFELLSFQSQNHIPSILGGESGLYSDSVEDRVKAFHRLLTRLNAEYADARDPMPNVLAATGAFLVGRGTSHSFLLRRVANKWPMATVWFGLLGAFGGPSVWDVEWMRAVKGVEKVLCSGLTGPLVSSADLSWIEYMWLRGLHEGQEVFGGFPKVSAKMLAVDVVPGVMCQLRLAGGNSVPQVDPERRMLNQMRERIRELEGAVENFVELAAQSRRILDDGSRSERRGQITFRFDESNPKRVKDTKRKTKGSVD
jgi:hypothetical protein